ncbi:MAG TPA: Xaa-Pro peptidase family protein [Candidatus Limnocylindria bacterium]|nr:Xaa-Pro peptidase family protein [Candidatus Limnocylindria bacterium]
MPTRLARARAILDDAGADALLVSGTATGRWLSGFALQPGEEHHRGFSGTLLVTADAALVLVDGRYVEAAEAQCPGWTLRLTTRPDLSDELPAIAAELGARRLAAQASVLTHADWSALESAGLELVAVDAAVDGLRVVKDADEVAAIHRACALTDACFDYLLGWLRPGMTERAVAGELESWFRANGAEALSFEPIVLVGARGSMPHGHPGETVLEVAQPLLIDFGCQVDGYRSDMTRTVSFGEPSRLFRERYDAVRAAQQAAFEAARPGMSGVELDGVARGVLADAGLGEAFSHGLGHGIGLETHETPMLKTWPHPLEAGMVFTLEPGVYLAGEMGIRIEDDVVLREDGAMRLTDSARELLIL